MIDIHRVARHAAANAIGRPKAPDAIILPEDRLT